jgi:hypothetical protein
MELAAQLLVGTLTRFDYDGLVSLQLLEPKGFLGAQ